MQQDFRVKSGIRLDGNIYGTNYLFANSIVVTYNGNFGNLFVSGKITGNVIGTVSSLDNHTTSSLKELCTGKWCRYYNCWCKCNNHLCFCNRRFTNKQGYCFPSEFNRKWYFRCCGKCKLTKPSVYRRRSNYYFGSVKSKYCVIKILYGSPSW